MVKVRSGPLDGKRHSTLDDVAALAGVSRMTASRALRGAGDVSPATVEKVRRAARDIGYVGNPLAASLSGQRSDLIGVVVPSVSNIVFAEVLAGIAEGIEGSGLQPVFGVTDYDPGREHDVIRSLLSWKPSGMIVTGLDQSEATIRLLKTADVPVVQIMDLDGTPVDACVGFSQAAAGAAMAQAMIARGRRRFGYVGCGLERDTRARKRLAGFEAALAGLGLGLAQRELEAASSTIGAGRRMTARLLSGAPDLDCIYDSNDDRAAGGALHCLAEGIAVPEALTLAGFNGLDIIDSLPVRVATSRTPRRDIGRMAAEILRRSRHRAAQGRPERIEVTPVLEVD